ncbi:MAG: hypothetical protein QW487_03055 [Candidatus Bathyarchaeia archaeon]
MEMALFYQQNLEQGKFVLFSTHPERNMETWGMLKNAIEFCAAVI